MTSSPMRDQVLSKPDLLTALIPEVAPRVQDVLSDADCKRLEKIYVTGCGDSHHASLCTELAFERWTGIPTEPHMSNQFGRYVAENVRAHGQNALVVSISASGTVSRTIETVQQARKAGALTMALTGTPDSPIAKAAERILNVQIPPPARGPGVRNYLGSLVGLYLLAARIGEARGHLSAAEAQAKRDALRATADVIRATIEASDLIATDFAHKTRHETNYVFTGHGPNFGTALFSAAKIMEASGDHAQGQDTEEWAHLQYFVRERTTPTLMIAPPGVGYSRAAELAVIVKRIGRPLVAIVQEGDTAISSIADFTLPTKGSVAEELSPVVYCTQGELYSAHLATAKNEPYFRAFSGTYSGGNGIRTSAMLD